MKPNLQMPYYSFIFILIFAVQHIHNSVSYITLYYILIDILFRFNPSQLLWKIFHPIDHNNWKISNSNTSKKINVSLVRTLWIINVKNTTKNTHKIYFFPSIVVILLEHYQCKQKIQCTSMYTFILQAPKKTVMGCCIVRIILYKN